MHKKIVIVVSMSLILMSAAILGMRAYCRYAIGYTHIYVASHQLSQRTLIQEEDLKEIIVPKDYIDIDAYLDKEDILGKYVRLSHAIPKGSFIYKGAVEDDIKDLAHTLLKKGEVTYDVFVNDVEVNTANLSTNMYVDLYLTIHDKDKAISDLLLANCRIIGFYDSNGKQIKEYDNESRIYVFALAIRKEDVVILNKAMVLGDLKVVVNSYAYDDLLSSSQNSASTIYEYLD